MLFRKPKRRPPCEAAFFHAPSAVILYFSRHTLFEIPEILSFLKRTFSKIHKFCLASKRQNGQNPISAATIFKGSRTQSGDGLQGGKVKGKDQGRKVKGSAGARIRHTRVEGGRPSFLKGHTRVDRKRRRGRRGKSVKEKKRGETPFCGIFAPEGGEKGINKKSQAKSLDKFDFL